MKRFAFTFSLLCFLGGAHSCIKDEERQGQMPLGKESKNQIFEASLSCEKDEDCTVIKADCCGCRQGGKQKAIAKLSFNAALEQQKNLCQDTICPQMISKDESCSKKPLCESGRCVLK